LETRLSRTLGFPTPTFVIRASYTSHSRFYRKPQLEICLSQFCETCLSSSSNLSRDQPQVWSLPSDRFWWTSSDRVKFDVGLARSRLTSVHAASPKFHACAGDRWCALPVNERERGSLAISHAAAKMKNGRRGDATRASKIVPRVLLLSARGRLGGP